VALLPLATAESVTRGVDLRGRTALVTGCAGGIGLETMRVLALRGAHVIGAARTRRRAAAACAAVPGKTTPLACDLAEPASVRAACEAVRALDRPLDIIVCNAGIMAVRTPTARHGVELQFLTNHLGHFLLVQGLLDALVAAPAGRVVVVSSSAHRVTAPGGIDFEHLALDDDAARQRYRPFRAYGRSKLANLLFARELDRRLTGTGAHANALHPGAISTGLGRNAHPLFEWVFTTIARPLLRNVGQGAATTCHLAARPELEGVGGRYFAACRETQGSARSRDDALARRLWEYSEAFSARH
jgi:WW domain-containing oxidoreductase